MSHRNVASVILRCITNVIDYDVSRQTFVDCGGCAALVRTLELHPSEPDVIFSGLKGVAIFCNSPVPDAFKSGSLCDVIINALRTFPAHFALFSMSCSAIAGIAFSAETINELNEKGVCELITDGANNFGLDRLDVTSQICYAICRMTFYGDNVTINARFIDAACPILIQALTLTTAPSVDSGCIVKVASTAIYQIASCANGIYQDQIGELGGCEAIVRTISSGLFAESRDHSFRAIWALILTQSGRKNTSNIRRFEALGIKSLLKRILADASLPEEHAAVGRFVFDLFP